LTIFDKFSTRTNVQRAKIQKEMAEYSLETEKTNLRATIERAFIDAKTSLKTFEATKKSVEAQEEAFRIAQERYDLGVLTSYDFDQVRNQLVNAQSSFIRAKYNFVFRSKFLEFYYGVPIKL
jgi:outer membrane protein